MKENSKRILTIVFMCLAMVVSASVDGIIGVFLPSVKQEFMVTDAKMALIFSTDAISIMLFTFIGGKLCSKLGHKKVFSIAFLIIVTGAIIMQFVSSYITLMCASFYISIGLSLLNISINSSTPITFITSQVFIMNLVYLFNGVGSATFKKFFGNMINQGMNWRLTYLFVAALAIILLAVLFKTIVPSTPADNNHISVKLKDILKNKLFILYSVILSCHIMAYTSTNAWLVNYIHFSYDIDVNKASTYLSGFMLCISVGMLISFPIVKKVDIRKLVIISSFLAFVTYFSGVCLGKNGLILISLAGIFVSILFSTTLVFISESFKNDSSYVMGLAVTIGCLINMLFGLLLGNLNDLIGIRTTYFIIPFTYLLFSILSFSASKIVKKNEGDHI